MTCSCSIRRANPLDADAIATVQIAAWRERMAQWVPAWFLERFEQDKQAEKYRLRLADPAINILVAENETGSVVGLIGSKRNNGEPLGYHQKIFGFYVDPAHEKQGIGSALLGAMLQEFKDHSVAKAIVFTFAENAPARRRYEAAGGVLLPYTDSPDLDLKIPHVSYCFSF